LPRNLAGVVRVRKKKQTDGRENDYVRDRKELTEFT
jgi:hypothetical protein